MRQSDIIESSSRKNGWIERFGRFETHHKSVAFLLVMIFTIAITRVIVFIHNPNPTLFHFELHHFDYGVLLLLITSLLTLFGAKKYNAYLFLSAVATGLIIDDYWFIRKSVVENDSLQTQIYNATFPSVLIFSVVVILILFFIHSLRKRKGE